MAACLFENGAYTFYGREAAHSCDVVRYRDLYTGEANRPYRTTPPREANGQVDGNRCDIQDEADSLASHGADGARL